MAEPATIWCCRTCFAGAHGNDTVYGGQGNDSVDYTGTTTGSNELIYGNLGNDTLIGGAGKDTLIGGAGDDSISGGVSVAGPAVSDVMTGGSAKTLSRSTRTALAERTTGPA